MPPAQTRHERILQVLNEAALAVQQAHTAEEIYEAVGLRMDVLGYRTFFLTLSRDRAHLRIERLSIPANLLAQAERMAGVSADAYQIPVETLADYQQVLTERRTMLVPDLIPAVATALPVLARPLAQGLSTLLILKKGILAPLVVAGQVSGVVIVSAEALDEEDVPIVTAFADQVSAALERARLFAELQEREWRATIAYEIAQQYARELEVKVEEEQGRLREISTLHTVAAVTAEELVAEVVMKRGLVATTELLELDGAAIYLVDDRGYVHPAFATGEPAPFLSQVQADPPLLRDLHVGPAILDGKPVLIEDLDDLDQPLPAHVRTAGMRTVANLPLRTGGRLLGILALNARRPGALTRNDLSLLTSIASQVATSLENARLFEQEQKRRAELDRLNNALRLLAERLQQSHDETAIAHLLCEAVVHAQGWKSVVVALRDTRTMRWHPVAQTGYSKLQMSALSDTSDRPAWLQEEFRLSHSYYVPDISTIRPDLAPEALGTGEPGKNTFLLAIPLEAGGRILGALLLAEREDSTSPSQREIEHLELFAAQAATALESIRLSRSVRMWANAVHHSGDAIAITGIEGQIISVNPAFELLTGYEQAEVVGQSLHILDSGLTSPSVFDDMWDTILAGEPWRGEVINRRKDGSVYDADLAVAPILDPGERLAGLVASQRDISRLKELDRLKTQFVSNVSHELRTPLTNIKLYQRYLREGRRPQLHVRFFDILDRETNRLIQLIEDLLDLSRLDAGTVPPIPKPLDWNEVVGSAVAAHEARATELGIALSFEPHNRPLYALANRVHLAQVITNLLTNALNYTPAGGQVEVHTSPAGGAVVASIRDTGYGIAPDEIDQIFDRFYRGDAARRSGSPGTGLGLNIVKQILDLYGGWVKVESAVGKGSTFTVSLPAMEEKMPVFTILLVEDDPDIRFLVNEQLKGEGYRVTPVTNGEEALASVQEQMPDLIVLDLLLPRMSGLQVLERLQTGEYGPPPPVLVITGTDSSMAHQALDLGASEFLTKPYSPQVFLDVVSRLLQTRAQGER